MVAVFREVRRVLRADGTCWVNMGDSYHGGGGGNYGDSKSTRTHSEHLTNVKNRIDLPGLKPKDLVGIPWRLAFALQADGWWLRSDIIWAKPNPMPESVTDRPTKAHEYVFLLTKAARYFYDADAVREAQETLNPAHPSYRACVQPGTFGSPQNSGERPLEVRESSSIKRLDPRGRNLRTVWSIATQPYPDAHFATFPEELPRRCIRAGSPTKVCADCGAGWVREIEVSYKKGYRTGHLGFKAKGGPDGMVDMSASPALEHVKTLGFRPSCECIKAKHPGKALTGQEWIDLADQVAETCTAPATVLDPFAGSGTTGQVAIQENRAFIGIELNPEYTALAEKRMTGVQRGLLP